MALPGDPFTPGPTADPTAGQSQPVFENLRNQWATFLDQPGARAALLQTGIALTQPRQFGQTPFGQVMNAVGAGAEAVSGGEMQQAKIQEMQNRAAVKEAQAGRAQERIGLEYFRQKALDTRAEQGREQRWADMYQRDQQFMNKIYERKLEKWEANRSLLGEKAAGPKPEAPPKMDYPTWRRTRGLQFMGPSGDPLPSSIPQVPQVQAAVPTADTSQES